MTEKHACSVEGCDPKNHDLCLCGHNRMDHLQLPVEEGGGCWGATGCYPRCREFIAASEEMVHAFFGAYMHHESLFGEMTTQEQSDKFRENFLAGVGSRYQK